MCCISAMRCFVFCCTVFSSPVMRNHTIIWLAVIWSIQFSLVIDSRTVRTWRLITILLDCCIVFRLPYDKLWPFIGSVERSEKNDRMFIDSWEIGNKSCKQTGNLFVLMRCVCSKLNYHVQCGKVGCFESIYTDYGVTDCAGMFRIQLISEKQK